MASLRYRAQRWQGAADDGARGAGDGAVRQLEQVPLRPASCQRLPAARRLRHPAVGLQSVRYGKGPAVGLPAAR